MTTVTTPKQSTPVASSSRVSPASQSPLSELLVLPCCTPKRKKTEVSKSARILTSIESLELLTMKEQKKKEEEEEKQRKKIEKERKKLEKEQEKVRKQQEREAKKAMKQQELEEKRKEKERKKAEKSPTSAKEYRASSSIIPRGKILVRLCLLKVLVRLHLLSQVRLRLNNRVRIHLLRVNNRVRPVTCVQYALGPTMMTLMTVETSLQIGSSVQMLSVLFGSHVNCLEREVGEFVCAICFSLFN